ncbi:hypothetical protein KIPB_013708 [Kipferlia bialata]|uniref:Uncharacterized protein n=1 Tax=Kipferlia bialata TaxID=797122 RepID=A0A9K3D9C9_9EUKA|nr:hypothetical protein KIPB_013708 [Kipferlia bialata]|eukprot:g13708.t1
MRLFSIGICLLLACSVRALLPYTMTWDPVPDDHEFTVVYLQQPMFSDTVGPLGHLINVYHTALGFYDTQDESIQRLVCIWVIYIHTTSLYAL